MRRSFHLVQYIFQFRGCGHNLEDTAKVGGHEEIFSSCSVYFIVQRLWSQSIGYGHGHGHEKNQFIKFNLI
jgi:hypothetical protein